MALLHVETAAAYVHAGFRGDREECGRFVDADYAWIDRALGFEARTSGGARACVG